MKEESLSKKIMQMEQSMFASFGTSLVHLWIAEMWHYTCVQWWGMAPLPGSLGLLIVTGECGCHSLTLCLFWLYKLEQISAERFECKPVLHSAKCPIISTESGCTSSQGIQSPEADWTVGLWGVLWHVDEDERAFSLCSESNPMGKNQQELFDRFDSDFYLIEASFFFE